MRDITIEEMKVDEVLKRWAAWLLVGVGGSRLHPLAVLVRDNVQQVGRSRYAQPLNDDDALQVDGYMAKLRLSNPQAFNIALDYYCYRLSYRVLGQRWRCSHQTIGNKLLLVRNYVAEAILGDVYEAEVSQDISDHELRDRLMRELELLLMASRAEQLFEDMRKAS